MKSYGDMNSSERIVRLGVCSPGPSPVPEEGLKTSSLTAEILVSTTPLGHDHGFYEKSSRETERCTRATNQVKSVVLDGGSRDSDGLSFLEAMLQ